TRGSVGGVMGRGREASLQADATVLVSCVDIATYVAPTSKRFVRRSKRCVWRSRRWESGQMFGSERWEGEQALGVRGGDGGDFGRRDAAQLGDGLEHHGEARGLVALAANPGVG